MKTVGLFAGIGGLERGLQLAGHETRLLCEIDPAARAVLSHRFPDVMLHGDVRDLRSLPVGTELVVAGFPCQDLSQAGKTHGIGGKQSSLVEHLFRLLRVRPAPWVLVENVPFMLQLQRGAAMGYLVSMFERLGYRWAYRIIDSLAFGLPQRRKRVFFLAGLYDDPATILLTESRTPIIRNDFSGRACGFYWTEGTRGLGWAVDAIPTLKGGSSIGIPSPPAIWLPDGRIVTPDLRDAERLQGFPADWTISALSVARSGCRWKLVGNAVSVCAAKWIGKRLLRSCDGSSPSGIEWDSSTAWPKAAFGSKHGGRFSVNVTTWPAHVRAKPLLDFFRYEPQLLSHRAISGFLGRLLASRLRYPEEFLKALRTHQRVMARDVLKKDCA